MLEQEAMMPLHELLAKMKEVGTDEKYCVERHFLLGDTQFCCLNSKLD